VNTLRNVTGGVEAKLAVDCRSRLGEGVVWDERRQVVLWTDINAARLWQYKPLTGETRSVSLPDRLGSFALCDSGCLLLGLAKGL
jgi:L-arabinonolactonase